MYLWKRITLALGLLALAACQDKPLPTAVPPDRPTQDISDGAHGGNRHFFFLAPLVASPTHSGTSDGSLSPRVMVCEWNAATTQCGTVVTGFSMEGGVASEVIRYDATSESYIVNWHTDRCFSGPCTLDPKKTYRLHVLVGAVELGHADVSVVSNGSQLKNIDTGSSIGLVNGRTLPVKFRIEHGAVVVLQPGEAAPIGASGGTIVSSEGMVALEIPAGAVPSTTSFTMTPTADVPGGAAEWAPAIDFGPDGTQFATPVYLTIRFDGSKLPPGVPLSALQIYLAQRDGWIPVQNSTVNEVENTVSAPIHHFSVYSIRISPNTITGEPTPTTINVGQTTSLSGYASGYQTYPATYCRWVRVGNGWTGYTYERRCYTYTESYYYPSSEAVYWSSSNPAAASIPRGPTYPSNGYFSSPPVLGVGAGLTDIIATSGGARSNPVGITVLHPPVIDPFPQHRIQLRLDVTQGGSGSVDVPIGNTGGGTLTNLALQGPVRNCYTGEQHTWLSDTWNTRTAPATLTLTAKPPASVPLGELDLCFTLTAEGSGAAPYGYGIRLNIQPPLVSETVSMGREHSCGLTISGAAYCWGANEAGQLGDGTTTDRHTPVAVSGNLTFTHISAGDAHSCGLTSSGIAYCWGGNNVGQLGIGTTGNRHTPMAVAGGITFRTIDAGHLHTVGVTTTGAAYAWGWNAYGQLGTGVSGDRNTPTVVAGGLNFRTVSAGMYHTVGLTTAGAAYGWGWNGEGQLGDGTTTNRQVPTAVVGGHTFKAISTARAHTVALTTAGAAYAWGWNAWGQLGDGTHGVNRPVPTAVIGGLTFKTISAGHLHTAALSTTGTAYLWGGNMFGQIGDGGSSHRFTPTAVSGSLSLRAISGGAGHVLGVTTAGAGYAWGDNGRGQLGDGSTTSRSTPVAVEGNLSFR